MRPHLSLSKKRDKKMDGSTKKVFLCSSLAILALGLGNVFGNNSLYARSKLFISRDLPAVWFNGLGDIYSINYVNNTPAASQIFNSSIGSGDGKASNSTKESMDPVISARRRMVIDRKELAAFMERERRPRVFSKDGYKLGGSRTVYSPPPEYDCEPSPAERSPISFVPRPTPSLWKYDDAKTTEREVGYGSERSGYGSTKSSKRSGKGGYTKGSKRVGYGKGGLGYGSTKSSKRAGKGGSTRVGYGYTRNSKGSKRSRFLMSEKASGSLRITRRSRVLSSKKGSGSSYVQQGGYTERPGSGKSNDCRCTCADAVVGYESKPVERVGYGSTTSSKRAGKGGYTEGFERGVGYGSTKSSKRSGKGGYTKGSKRDGYGKGGVGYGSTKSSKRAGKGGYTKDSDRIGYDKGGVGYGSTKSSKRAGKGGYTKTSKSSKQTGTTSVSSSKGSKEVTNTKDATRYGYTKTSNRVGSVREISQTSSGNSKGSKRSRFLGGLRSTRKVVNRLLSSKRESGSKSGSKSSKRGSTYYTGAAYPGAVAYSNNSKRGRAVGSGDVEQSEYADRAGSTFYDENGCKCTCDRGGQRIRDYNIEEIRGFEFPDRTKPPSSFIDERSSINCPSSPTPLSPTKPRPTLGRGPTSPTITRKPSAPPNNRGITPTTTKPTLPPIKLKTNPPLVNPTQRPQAAPTPVMIPTASPTKISTPGPTQNKNPGERTTGPSLGPYGLTSDPTAAPTIYPDPDHSSPTSDPTSTPAMIPTFAPTDKPTPNRDPGDRTPTADPTAGPTLVLDPGPFGPTSDPTLAPTINLDPGPSSTTSDPTSAPTIDIDPGPPSTTSDPTSAPTVDLDPGPSGPTSDPTLAPTIDIGPGPISDPTSAPTVDLDPGPSGPTSDPTLAPTVDLQIAPSSSTPGPTSAPTVDLDPGPSGPNSDPTSAPTIDIGPGPILDPTSAPTFDLEIGPSGSTPGPSSAPTEPRNPGRYLPSTQPSAAPSTSPRPTFSPISGPTLAATQNPSPVPSPDPTICDYLIRECPESCQDDYSPGDLPPRCSDVGKTDCNELPFPSGCSGCCPDKCYDSNMKDCIPTPLPSPAPTVGVELTPTSAYPTPIAPHTEHPTLAPTNRPISNPTSSPTPQPSPGCGHIIGGCPNACLEEGDRPLRCSDPAVDRFDCNVVPFPNGDCPDCCPDECYDHDMEDCDPTPQPTLNPTRKPTTPYPTPTAPHTEHPTSRLTQQPSPGSTSTPTKKPSCTDKVPSPAPTTNCADLIRECPKCCFEEDESDRLPRCTSIERDECNEVPLPNGCNNCCPDECYDHDMKDCNPTTSPSLMPSLAPSCPGEERDDNEFQICESKKSVLKYYQHGNNKAPPRNPIHSIAFGTSGNSNSKTVSFKISNPFEATHEMYTHYEQVDNFGFGDMQCAVNLDQEDCKTDISVTANCNAQSQTVVHIYAVGKSAKNIKLADGVTLPKRCTSSPEISALPENTVLWTYTIDCECDLDPDKCFCEP